MTGPTVDILMATYNGESYVAEQIESIQHQTCQDWRLLVSDDCSTDGTLDVVRRYAAEDGRIRVVSEGVRHGGAKGNFFSLMGASTSAFFMFCDQDDVWLPQKIEKELDEARSTEGELGSSVPIAVYTDMRVVDDTLHETAPSFLAQDRKRDVGGDLRQFLSISCAAGCTMLCNAALRNLVIGTDCSAALMHDWWLCIIAASCGALVYLDEPTVLYRQHSDNEVGAVTYSFWRRLARFEDSRRKYWRSCEQARAILGTYSPAMRDGGRSLVEAYASQLDGSFRRSLHSLLSHKLLKRGGGRKAAQVLTLLMGAPVTERRDS